jgi:hypothetical protein
MPKTEDVQVEKFLSQTFASHIAMDVPEILYHYTTQQGLLEIVRGSQLWATKVQYMDDSTEFRLAKILASRQLKKRLEQETDPIIKKKIQALNEISGSPNLNILSPVFAKRATY